ncbi:hypothetical protein HU200_059576 [Digitaria exilis]|uniref:Uncharacterized protein n=1 Tax=Digitaria exilis TaxID=1010633 RepID=A0A835AAW5_9POAL|nr:hypothetical protein HU200_059576 [Digitaria exilis]
MSSLLQEAPHSCSFSLMKAKFLDTLGEQNQLGCRCPVGEGGALGCLVPRPCTQSPPRKHNERGPRHVAIGLHLTLVTLGKHHTRGPLHARLNLHIMDLEVAPPPWISINTPNREPNTMSPVAGWFGYMAPCKDGPTIAASLVEAEWARHHYQSGESCAWPRPFVPFGSRPPPRNFASYGDSASVPPPPPPSAPTPAALVAVASSPVAPAAARRRGLLAGLRRHSSSPCPPRRSPSPQLLPLPQLVVVASSPVALPQLPLPCTYLGIPLSIYKLRKAELQPLVDKVANALPTWKAGLLNLALSPWAIGCIDKRRRAFLWRGTEMVSGGHCLLAWPKCCRPIHLGGLGLPNLQTATDLGHSSRIIVNLPSKKCSKLGPRVQKCRTVREAFQNRRWVRDIVGAITVQVPSQHNTSTLGRCAGYLPRHLKRYERITREAELDLPLPACTNDLTHSPIGGEKADPKTMDDWLINTALSATESCEDVPTMAGRGIARRSGGVRTHPVPPDTNTTLWSTNSPDAAPRKASWYSSHKSKLVRVSTAVVRSRYHRRHNTWLTQKLAPGSPKA